jgi:phosphatidylglycerol:prolipoprotein diacylglycerol transferase
VDGLLLFCLLMVYFPWRRRDGEVMALLMVTYPVTRFLIEGLRQDEGAFFAGLTVSQLVSVGLFLGGIGVWFYLSGLPKGRFADRSVDPSRPGRAVTLGRLPDDLPAT